MIKLLCITPFETVELKAGVPFRPPVPVYSLLNGEDEEIQIIINEKAERAEPGWTVRVSGDLDITVIAGDNDSASFFIRPSVDIVPLKTGISYEDFYYQYGNITGDTLQAVLERKLYIYAPPQPELKEKDFSKVLKELESAYPHIKAICAKPRSHLKSINEIRPIETVKRIGHESIPYLASHSEDWLARTASGLKPSRLYSRVEEDDYQIYENRVIKTLIDDAVTYLRRKYHEMDDLKEQLDQIIENTDGNLESAGFDASHQKCMSKILGKDPYESFVSGTKQRQKAVEQLARITRLLRLYEELKKSRLYKSNYRSKRVTGSLLQTNILMMDKHYHQAGLLWKPLREALIKEDTEMRDWVGDGHLTPVEADAAYVSFCEVMCKFALYSLGFSENTPCAFDREDDVCVAVESADGKICLTVADNSIHEIKTNNEILSPIEPGTSFGPFSYDGKSITWRQKLDSKEIESFAWLHKKIKRKGAEKKYAKVLYDSISEINKQSSHSVHRIFLLPSFCELTETDKLQYKEKAEEGMLKLCRMRDAEKGFVLMPIYGKNQRDIAENALYEDEKIGFIPVSMFDINSYRRIRNILLRYIIQLTEKRCPCCGKRLYESGKGDECRNPDCMKIFVRHEICDRCKNPYSYIWTDFSLKELQGIAALNAESGPARFDSRFLYRNNVPMVVRNNRLEALCPWHRNE